MEIIDLKTNGKCEMVDITRRIREVVSNKKWAEGNLACIFHAHHRRYHYK